VARELFKKNMMLSWQVELAKEFCIPVESQRFWVWAKRKNNTYRPSRPLTLQEENIAVSVSMLCYV
jgi:ubiquitin carboxyl-terminal hydrolase 7